MSGKLIGFFQSITGKADSVLTTKADLATYSTARTRLGVGSNDTVLTADSTEATGLKWSASGGLSSPLTSNLVVNDSINLLFGTGSDSSIDYNGSNMVIDPQVVGSGSLFLNAGALIFPARTNVTLSSGVATLVNNIQGIDTEGSASTDDCNTATPVSLTNPAPYWLCSVISSRDVTMKDGGSDLFLEGDFTFNYSTDQMELVARDGNNNLFEVSRSNND